MTYKRGGMDHWQGQYTTNRQRRALRRDGARFRWLISEQYRRLALPAG